MLSQVTPHCNVFSTFFPHYLALEPLIIKDFLIERYKQIIHNTQLITHDLQHLCTTYTTFLTKQKITHTKNQKVFEKRVPKISNKNACEYKLLVLTSRINNNLDMKYIFKVNIN